LAWNEYLFKLVHSLGFYCLIKDNSTYSSLFASEDEFLKDIPKPEVQEEALEKEVNEASMDNNYYFL
jgi:hypothetical protein